MLCIRGYTLDINEVCQPCAANCLSCLQSGIGACDIGSCEAGYGIVSSGRTPNTNACLKCISGCNKCDLNILSCDGCIDGTYMSIASDGSTYCNLCPINCSTCVNADNCTTCNFGYNLVSNICMPNC